MNIAVIPARGGSKRIPRKNIKLFNGAPIITYAIKAAQESNIFQEIFVSTDDEEIAEVATSYGASVPWLRSKNLSDDYATTMDVMHDFVNKLRFRLTSLENICCIYPATPLLKPKFLHQGLQIIEKAKWNYVFSALKVNSSPQRAFSISSSKGVELLFPEYEETRTQDIQVTYSDAGQFYWGKKTSWESALPIFTKKSTILELPREFALDIDTMSDWEHAERLFDLVCKE
jgi:N-acylneuraminate cytidylyltransferase